MKIEKQLVELETQFWQALKDKDAATAVRLTDETCIVSGPQGVSRVERQAIAGMVKDEKSRLEDFALEDIQVRRLGDDVAIIAYKAHEELRIDGERVALDVIDSSTWVRKNGNWVCAAHTEAVAGDPYGRDKKTS